MIGDVAIWIVAAAAAVALLTAFLLRTRIPAPLVTVALTVAGGALGWGGMLMRPDPSLGEFVAAVVLLAVLVPAHVRIVLGRFGPRAATDPTPASTLEEEESPAGP
jgi:hypothetical protein